MTTLVPHRRGDTFGGELAPRTFTLALGWTGASFTGGVFFTLRRRIPGSTVSDDTDDDVVAQASSLAGEITFTGTGVAGDPCIGSILLPAWQAALWPARRLFWDLEGRIAGNPELVKGLDDGEIEILPDITRGPVDS